MGFSSLCVQSRILFISSSSSSSSSSYSLLRSPVPRSTFVPICKWISKAGTISSNKLFAPYSPMKRAFSCVRAERNEEDAAVAAASLADSGAPTIFDKIIKKEIPSTVVYEDDKVLAFRDINPQAPIHIILIPKIRDGLTQLSKAEPKHKDILGHLMYATALIAKQEGLDDGYRLVINDGPKGCQSVYHLHLHILGGRQLKWPPG